MSAFITVNGVQFPYPDYDSGLQTSATLVNSGRNANGVLVGQQIGRTQSKVELSWNVLDAAVWASMLQQFRSNFIASVTYYDMEQGGLITRRMYVSDRTAKPFTVDPKTGIWIKAKQCKLNLIDTGA
jgi:hypothetical protein